MAVSDGNRTGNMIGGPETTEVRTWHNGSMRQAINPSDFQNIGVTGVTGQSTKSSEMLSVSITLNKLPLLDSKVDKVEKTYCVSIRKDSACCAASGQATPDLQWITISGSKGDCKDAGVRILTLSCCMI